MAQASFGGEDSTSSVISDSWTMELLPRSSPETVSMSLRPTVSVPSTLACMGSTELLVFVGSEAGARHQGTRHGPRSFEKRGKLGAGLLGLISESLGGEGRRGADLGSSVVAGGSGPVRQGGQRKGSALMETGVK